MEKVTPVKRLARALYPELDDDEDIFFTIGAKNATFEGYDGQPVIIWDDRRDYSLLEELGGRENVFNVFDTILHIAKLNGRLCGANGRIPF